METLYPMFGSLRFSFCVLPMPVVTVADSARSMDGIDAYMLGYRRRCVSHFCFSFVR